MVAKRRSLNTDAEVQEAVDGLLAAFGVVDDAIISTADAAFERKPRPRIKDGGHGKGAGSASTDALWSKRRK
jgi:hypothetical protein